MQQITSVDEITMFFLMGYACMHVFVYVFSATTSTSQVHGPVCEDTRISGACHAVSHFQNILPCSARPGLSQGWQGLRRSTPRLASSFPPTRATWEKEKQVHGTAQAWPACTARQQGFSLKLRASKRLIYGSPEEPRRSAGGHQTRKTT